MDPIPAVRPAAEALVIAAAGPTDRGLHRDFVWIAIAEQGALAKRIHIEGFLAQFDLLIAQVTALPALEIIAIHLGRPPEAGLRPSLKVRFRLCYQSDLCLFCHLQGVIHLDPEIPHRALKLRVTEQQLHSTQVLGPFIDQTGFGAAN